MRGPPQEHRGPLACTPVEVETQIVQPPLNKQYTLNYTKDPYYGLRNIPELSRGFERSGNIRTSKPMKVYMDMVVVLGTSPQHNHKVGSFLSKDSPF